MRNDNSIAVIDFGSQTCKLIARRIRELGVFSKIYQTNVTAQELKEDNVVGIIISGGPESLGQETNRNLNEEIFSMGIPILGICYGMQLIVKHFGGTISRGTKFEFGIRDIDLTASSDLFNGLNKNLRVWMSHYDQAFIGDEEFKVLGFSKVCPHAAIAHEDKKIYGVQFHPEVSHTEGGKALLKNFIYDIAKCRANFDLADVAKQKIKYVKNTVKDEHVIMGLSGGVDSSVAAVLISRAIKNNLHCVYVNHGLHREGEITEIKNLFSHVLKSRLSVVDASEEFFLALKGVTDPEEKRKVIGHTFINVFDREAKRLGNITFLGQGTLYPDVIESQCRNNGPSHVIKSHHNVGGLPERMNLKLIEPLDDLFKDEVRKLGKVLGLNDAVVNRQPFPGPGLAVRIPGEVTKNRVFTLRKADAIVKEEISFAKKNRKVCEDLWQWFAILLPVKSVGVKGDARSYGDTVVLRVVKSIDAMTADWAKIPYDILENISCRITNEIESVTRVLYDITQKPPGTIEWE